MSSQSIPSLGVKTRSMKDADKLSSQKVKREYCHISKEKKIQLIQTVLKQKCRIKKIAKDLNINYATAKTILHCYRKKAISLEMEKPNRTANVGPRNDTSQLTMVVMVNDKIQRTYEYYNEMNIKMRI